MAIINGTNGIDILVGTTGNDILKGLGGADDIFGGAGNDTLEGGAGADDLDGGNNIDTASYSSAAQGVGVDLLGNVGFAGDADFDVYFGIENVTGSAFADILIGDNAANVLRGGAGADQLDGGFGIDTADYATSKQGVSVTLFESRGNNGDAEGDTYFSIENVIGSANSDSLTGDNAANVLSGGAGDDHLLGFAGSDTLKGGAGNDTLLGGAGADDMDGGSGSSDTLDYRFSPAGVTVDLGTNSAGGGDAGGDTIKGFENLIGSAHDDFLFGSAGANSLQGGAGADALLGGRGRDELTGGAGADFFGYGNTADSGVTAATRDLIRDFNRGQEDKLVFELEDAGGLDLSFKGQQGFTAAGQVRFFFEGDHTVVAVNTVGTSGAEMQIELDGRIDLKASDFLFGVLSRPRTPLPAGTAPAGPLGCRS